MAVSELQFHLYLNAFANNRTTFFTESGGQLRNQTAALQEPQGLPGALQRDAGIREHSFHKRANI